MVKLIFNAAPLVSTRIMGTGKLPAESRVAWPTLQRFACSPARNIRIGYRLSLLQGFSRASQRPASASAAEIIVGRSSLPLDTDSCSRGPRMYHRQACGHRISSSGSGTPRRPAHGASWAGFGRRTLEPYPRASARMEIPYPRYGRSLSSLRFESRAFDLSKVSREALSGY